MSGRDDRDVEHLTLPEPAASLFRRTREALETHVGLHTPNGEGIRLTGGTVLAARWRHRRSDDIDITYDPETETAHFDATLRPALEAVGGRSLAWGEWSRVEFGDNHIDLLKAEPQPAIGQGRAVIDASPVTVLTSTQIINAKLHNRSLDPPVRDVYDIAVCGIEDPGSLERSANGVYAATMDATILIWKMHQAEHADRARDELYEVPSRLEPVRRDPAPYAIHAAEQALYRRVTITCDGRTVVVRTTSGWGKRETAYETVEQLNRGFEASGMNLFLRAHGHSSARTRERAIRAMGDGGQSVVLDVEPSRPPQRAEPLATEVPSAGAGGPEGR